MSLTIPKAHILLVTLIVLVCSSCDFTTADEYFDRALDFSEKENYEAAIASLDKAIEKNPEFIDAFINRGVYKSHLKKYIASNADHKRALKYDPDNTYALQNIAMNLINQKKHDDAVLYFSKALDTEDVLKAMPTSDGKVTVKNPNFFGNHNDSDYTILDCEIYYYRGISYLRGKRYDKAIMDFQKSLNANYAMQNNYFFLGEAYLGKKDSINACQNFIESARLGDLEAREKLKEHCLKKKSK